MSTIARILPKLLALRRPLPVVASARERDAIEDLYNRPLEFYEISLLALTGDKDAWRDRVEVFVRSGKLTPYYQWYFVR